jgi:hypothetical protein
MESAKSADNLLFLPSGRTLSQHGPQNKKAVPGFSIRARLRIGEIYSF